MDGIFLPHNTVAIEKVKDMFYFKDISNRKMELYLKDPDVKVATLTYFFNTSKELYYMLDILPEFKDKGLGLYAAAHYKILEIRDNQDVNCKVYFICHKEDKEYASRFMLRMGYEIQIKIKNDDIIFEYKY